VRTTKQEEEEEEEEPLVHSNTKSEQAKRKNQNE
jgi:hypothetical protein